jgi:phage terminase large subunit-like protein
LFPSIWTSEPKYMSQVAEKYIDDVLSGQVPAGPYIIKAFQRHRRDLARTDIYFDGEAGNFVIDFIQTFCIPAEQEVPLKLTPWQHAVLYITYGWKRADGTRRFRRTYLEIAKKNGKTELLAALAHYHLIADGEVSPRVFIAATTGKQADHCFKSAVAMRDKHPDLRAAVRKSGENPTIALFTENLGRISKMARDAAGEDGALVSCAILDEFHRWKHGSNLKSVLRYGVRTFKQPMQLAITTAGASEGGTTPCWEEHEYGIKILDGLLEDDEFAPWIFCMDAKDDWKNPNNWVKSNPSLGYLFDLDTIQKEYAEAQGKPTEIGEFKRFCLNIWVSASADPAIEIDNWDLCCREPIENHPDGVRLFLESVAELKGQRCFAGLDVAPKNDTSALVLLFPPTEARKKWRVLVYFWCPKDNVAQRVKRDHVPYDVWSDKKFITLTPGDMTDMRFIANKITELSHYFDLRELYYDRAFSDELVRMLGEEGFDMRKFVPFRQTYLQMNGPCHDFMRMLMQKEFVHDNNPVLRWQMSNLRWATQKSTGWIMPARDRKREKIDGCASLIMALACATNPDNIVKPKKSLWVVTSNG